MLTDDKNLIEIYQDYIDDEGYVQRYNYDKGRYYNTGTCLRGPKGNPGNPGRPGKDGLTPRINQDNGHWMIGDVDTGVMAGGGQSDWNQNDSTKLDYIKNKPTISSGSVILNDSYGAFDLSVHNAVNGVPTTYADLSAALTALNALDSTYKKPGMSFRFVRSSDNKYVQFRYMLEYANTTAGNAAFVNVANWQGVDSRLVAGSKNLVESGVVKEEINKISLYSAIPIIWQNDLFAYVSGGKVLTGGSTSYKLAVIDITEHVGKTIKINCVSNTSSPSSLARNAFADANDDCLMEISQTVEDNPKFVEVPLNATKLYLSYSISLNTSEGYVGVQSDITDKIEEIEEIESNISENADFNNAAILMPNALDRPIVRYEGKLISNQGTLQDFSNYNVFSYDVSSLNDGNTYIYIFAKGYAGYYPDSFALGRFIVDGVPQPVPCVNKRYLNGYKVLVPQGSTVFDIAINTNGRIVITNSNATIRTNILSYTELDRKLLAVKTELPIAWTNNYACDGTRNIGNAISFVSNSEYRVGKIDVEAYRGQIIGLYCISSRNYTIYIDSFICDSSDIIVEKGLYMNEYMPMRIIHIEQNAKYLYITNYKIRDYVKVGIVDYSSLQQVVADKERVIINLPITWVADNTFYTVNNNKVVQGNANGYKAGVVDVSSYIGSIALINCASKSETNTADLCHAFTDNSDNLLDGSINVKPSQVPARRVVPENATKLYITCYKAISGDSASVSVEVLLSDAILNNYNAIQNIKNDVLNIGRINNWNGKKILWLGTSIPWGQSDEDNPGAVERVAHPYPQQVCSTLGATLVDSTNGGLAQMALYDETSGKWYPKQYGSTCLTIAECQEAYAAGLVSSDLSGFSYENKLLSKNADLYIFDVEPNNNDTGSAADLALFDWYLWKYTDNSTLASHRNTYIGALIYEIDQLLTEKPNATIVFIGEYLPMKSDTYMNAYGVRTQSEALCEKFHIHYINLAEKLFYVGKNKSVWINNDNTHPKQVTYDRMAKMLVNELLLIA